MLRARQQGVSGHHVKLVGPDPKSPGKKTSMSIHEWFNLGVDLIGDDQKDQLREADDLLLAALSDESNGWVVKRNILQSPLVTAMATGYGDMDEAFREIAPGTESDAKPKGLTYLACLVNWIQIGCPIIPIKPKLLGLAAAAIEPEPEPLKLGFPWGMGKVH
jgi:hypothetical protein